ncbi:Acg family FMN-binding oxidoreductase [Modestobacter lapidis]
MLDADQWQQVVGQAVRAPSIHNTQPWLFAATGDRLDVRLDPGRALPAIDPTRRQQVVSCGVAVHFAVVALAALGHAGEAELVPDPADPDHLATIRVTGAREPSAAERELAGAIARRHTDRLPFLDRPVPTGLVDELQAEIGRDGVWLKPVSREDEEAATVFLLGQVEQLEQRDPAYLAELHAWTRTDPTASDGVPVAALPEGDRSRRPSNWLVRDFVADPGAARPPAPAAADDEPPPSVEHPAVLLLGTMSDDRAGWLQAGQALGRLLLRVTVAGLAASPLTQALDQPWARNRLSHRLALVGHPQMLLRLGYPAGEAVASGRRPVAEVLRVD